MKVFFVITLLCILSVSVIQALTREEAEETFRALAADCVEKSGATAEDLDGIVNHKPFKSREGKCLAECVMKKFNTLSANGELNKTSLMQFAELLLKDDTEKLKLAEEIVDSCLHIQNDDHCELAAEFGICLHNGMDEKKLDLNW